MARMMCCGKSQFKCECWTTPSKPVKAKVRDSKTGRMKTVNTGNKVDANGNEWCACTFRVVNGKCTNQKCNR